MSRANAAYAEPQLFAQAMDMAIDARIEQALSQQPIIAYSLSGGKDSAAISHEANAYLDSIGHPRADRVAIHADLGRAEWKSTPAMVKRTAAGLGVPLITVRRQAGDMVARFEKRFENAKRRYENLETYNLIGPWAQANKRFCTSELKAQVIGPELARRYRGRTVISVIGIRREESTGRAATPISALDNRFAKAGNRHGTTMISWHPGINCTTEAVFACHDRNSIPLHEAYVDYGSTRLSCAYCVLASLNDLRAASKAAGNLDLFLHYVGMEATSTFSFQPLRWLADVAPALLPPSLARDIARAKSDCHLRQHIEAVMPAGLRYVKGWPLRAPTPDEAAAIAAARAPILERHQLANHYRTPTAIIARFNDLIKAKAAKEAAV